MNKKDLHKKVFLRQTEYKPLAVYVTSDAQPYTFYEAMRDPQKAIANAENTFKNTRQVESDVVPFVESNFMECLVPSIFGAETHVAPGGLIDVKPLFTSIYETEKIGEIDIFSGEMENAIKHLEYLAKNTPDYLYVNPTRPMSPLDYAVVLRGGDFYMELALEPELAISFMEKITDATIKTIKHFKGIINQPAEECITVRGYMYPGIRLTGDAIVNLSPSMIEEYMCPLYKKFEKEFGKVMLHYCCTPAPSTHVIHALASGGGIDCVDNWQGYKTLIKDDELQTKISVCTDVTAEQIKSGELKDNPFFALSGRPLITSTHTGTIEEGIGTYEKWRELWG